MLDMSEKRYNVKQQLNIEIDYYDLELALTFGFTNK
jgi:hypothetical protein